MEIKLNEMWSLKLDPGNIGEEMKWYIPDAFPEKRDNYWAPQLHDSRAMTGADNVWLLKDFKMETINPDSVYNLVFYGADKAKVWINGKWAGYLTRTVSKQVLDVTGLLRPRNTIVMKFESVTPLTIGLSKNVFLIQDSTRTALSKKSVARTPAWIESSQIYCVYVRNFSDTGDFEGVYQRLEYIRSLGTTLLWFMPIHPIGNVGRKGGLGCPYAISDYYGINPEYGDHNDFKQLVDRAHTLGMKVIIDLVINHTAKDSVMGNTDKRYHKPKERRVADLWGWTDVTDLDYDYPPTRSYITDMMAYWIKEFDIDGYRCDVAFLVPDDFWKEAIRHIRTLKPDLVMLAESDVPEQHLAGFDLSYDWHFMGLLRRIAQGYYPLSEIECYINTQLQYFPINALRMICIENHDTDRAAGVIPSSALLYLQVLRLMSPGVPLIYNGEENACSHRPDLFDKDVINWKTPDPSLLHAISTLGKLRGNTEALQQQDNKTVTITTESKCLIIQRVDSANTLRLSIDRNNFTFDLILNGKSILSSK